VSERAVTGVVTAQLPSGLYQVELEGARKVTAHLGLGGVGGGTARNFVRILVGDRVDVELTPRDPTRGRIIGKQTVGKQRRKATGDI
jgi:translation initiation factor IF-1